LVIFYRCTVHFWYLWSSLTNKFTFIKLRKL